MGIKIYLFLGGDEDRSKVVYLLDLRMRMRLSFYYGDGIMILVPAPYLCHP